MCGMEAQRQAEGVAAQPMSAHALLRGISEEGLTNGVRYASVAGMNSPAATQTTGGGALLPSLAI